MLRTMFASGERGIEAEAWAVSCAVAHAVKMLGEDATRSRGLTPFDCACESVPDITVVGYVRRLVTRWRCTWGIVVGAVIYLRRLTTLANIRITDRNVHRILLSWYVRIHCVIRPHVGKQSFLASCKFWEDQTATNRYYAKAGGVTPAELNRLELYFLGYVQFSLFVTAEDAMRTEYELLGFLMKL